MLRQVLSFILITLPFELKTIQFSNGLRNCKHGYELFSCRPHHRTSMLSYFTSTKNRVFTKIK